MIAIDSFRKTQAIYIQREMFVYNEDSSINNIYSGTQRAPGQGAALFPFFSIPLFQCWPADKVLLTSAPMDESLTLLGRQRSDNRERRTELLVCDTAGESPMWKKLPSRFADRAASGPVTSSMHGLVITDPTWV